MQFRSHTEGFGHIYENADGVAPDAYRMQMINKISNVDADGCQRDVGRHRVEYRLWYAVSKLMTNLEVKLRQDGNSKMLMWNKKLVEASRESCICGTN